MSPNIFNVISNKFVKATIVTQITHKDSYQMKIENDFRSYVNFFY